MKNAPVPQSTLAALAVLLSAASALAAPPASSDRCGTCHVEIYRTWRNSAHADAMEDPRFLAAFREIEAASGDAAVRPCLACHAPLTAVNHDWKLQYKVTWEGVNCEVCHGLVAVDFSGPNPAARYEIGPVKRGPIEDAASGEHEVAYSALHTVSEVCAPCHEYANPEGTPLITSYSEWKASDSARRGVHCQHCHMSRTAGNVVDPRVARVAHAEINLHEVPGGHSLDQLQKALAVSLKPERDPDSVTVEVEIRNKGAGHAVPTGMPGRRVILTVEARAGTGETYRGERIYGKFYDDAEGRRIEGDSRLFQPGVRLGSDTRIKADERRTERFRFPVATTTTAYIKARLQYEHAPTAEAGEATSLVFYAESRTLTASR